MIIPCKISFTKKSVNDQVMRKVGSIILSIMVALGIVEGFVTGKLKPFEIIIGIFIILGSVILIFNFISSKSIKITIASVSFIVLFVNGIRILATNQNYENLGWLYLVLSFTFFAIFIFGVLFIQKLLIFDRRKESKHHSYIISLASKELKKLSLFLFLWTLALSLNWFVVSVNYHSVYVLSLSLIFLCMFIYLNAKGESNLKITKSITGFLPLYLFAFMSDYIIWRRFVFGYLSTDKTLGIINFHDFGLWGALGIKFFFSSVTIILGILTIHSMIKYFSLMKLEEGLNNKLFIEHLKVKYYPAKYLSFLIVFYPFPIIQLFFYIGLYTIPLLFFIFAYHSFFSMKKEVTIDYSKRKDLQKENIVEIFLKWNVLAIWIILIPILLVSGLAASFGGALYSYYLVITSLNVTI